MLRRDTSYLVTASLPPGSTSPPNEPKVAANIAPARQTQVSEILAELPPICSLSEPGGGATFEGSSSRMPGRVSRRLGKPRGI